MTCSILLLLAVLLFPLLLYLLLPILLKIKATPVAKYNSKVVEPASFFYCLLLLVYHPALEERTLRHMLSSDYWRSGDRKEAAEFGGSGDRDISHPLRLMTSLGFSAGSSSYQHDLCCYGAGIAGNIFAFVLFVSPLPTFRRIVRNGSTEQFSAMPYIYSLLSCLVCTWYALPFVSYGVVLVATVNTVGAAFQLAYTAVFIAYADAKNRLKVSLLLVGVFSAFGLIVYVSMALFDHKPRQALVGYLSVASLICMFASPLSIINLVIRTKSVEYMPFYLSLSMSLMSVSFLAYGLLLDDFFIYIPNGIGTVLGVIQLLLYAYFRKGPRDECRRPLLVTHT